MPSVRLIQAPVFHGYSLSFWVEFERRPGIEALERLLASEPVDLRGTGVEPPNIVGVAGQSGIAVGALTADRNDSQACWFWAAVDNIRLSAEEALAVARQLL
jgi:aspartate-semialdehyde dehydrogenase